MRRVVAVAVVALGLLALLGLRGGDPYTVKMELANAQGLKPGSPVTIGGVIVGKVELDVVGDGVEVELEIEDDYAPLGRDATLAVVAQNLLGQKQVSVEGGDRANPAPEDYTYPGEQIRETADLDELLAALDPDTRTRLAIVLDQAGKAFAGRQVDFERLLTDIGPALASGADVLGQLARENRALENLLTSSDRWVAALTPARRRLSRMIDVLGRTTEVAAERRELLRETIRRAPGALRNARSLLAELREATGPLALTARQLTETAPPLQEALLRLEPFREAAQPALRRLSQETAPALARLIDDGSGPLRHLVPLVGDVRRLSERQVPPVGDALDRSVDNLLATVHNWSRAIQFRDGLGRIFRGELTIAPDLYDSVIERVVAQLGLDSTANRRRVRQALEQVREGEGGDASRATPEVEDAENDTAEEPTDALDALEEILPDLGGDGMRQRGYEAPSGGSVGGLLVFLLG